MGLKRASPVALCPEVGVGDTGCRGEGLLGPPSRWPGPSGLPASYLLVRKMPTRPPGALHGRWETGSCVFPQVLGSLASPLPLSTREISAICLLYCFGGGVILSGDEQGEKRLHTLPSPPPGCQADPSNLASLGLG